MHTFRGVLEMILKSFLVFVVLFEAGSASQTGQSNSKLTYQSLVKRIKTQCCCSDWNDGVLKYYKRTTKTSKEYPGPINQAEPLMKAFEVLLNKLLDLTTSNSKNLSSSSTEILDAMSMLSKLGGSYGNLFNKMVKRLPQLYDALRKIVSNLSDNIGQLTDLMNCALTDLEQSILHFAFTFQKSGVEHFGNGFGEKTNYEPITKYAQVLMNIIALIAETTINDCNISTPEVFESLAVLTLISYYHFIGAHSVNIVAQAILLTSSQIIPVKLQISLEAMAPLLQPIANVIDTIEDESKDNLVQTFTQLVNFTISLNTKLENIFEPFDGVGTTVGQITNTLLIANKKTF